MIVAILNPKGGSGKTTLSANLARALHQRGRAVLIVDTDPQGSLRDWHAATEDNPLPLVALDRPNNIRTLPGIAAGYDFVVVDGAAKLEDMSAAAIKVADYILIPVQPSPYDVWGVSDLVDLIKARQQVTDGRPQAAFVVTRRIQGTRLGDDIRRALSEYGLATLRGAIAQRQAYPQTAAGGQTVFDRGGNAQSRNEIEAVTAELLDTFDSTGGDP